MCNCPFKTPNVTQVDVSTVVYSLSLQFHTLIHPSQNKTPKIKNKRAHKHYVHHISFPVRPILQHDEADLSRMAEETEGEAGPHAVSKRCAKTSQPPSPAAYSTCSSSLVALRVRSEEQSRCGEYEKHKASNKGHCKTTKGYTVTISEMRLHECVRVCVCMHMNAYVDVHTCMGVCVCVCLHACVHACACVCVHACVCLHLLQTVQNTCLFFTLGVKFQTNTGIHHF